MRAACPIVLRQREQSGLNITRLLGVLHRTFEYFEYNDTPMLFVIALFVILMLITLNRIYRRRSERWSYKSGCDRAERRERAMYPLSR